MLLMMLDFMILIINNSGLHVLLLLLSKLSCWVLCWGWATRLNHLFEQLHAHACRGLVAGSSYVHQSAVVAGGGGKAVPLHISEKLPARGVRVAAPRLPRVELVHLILH